MIDPPRDPPIRMKIDLGDKANQVNLEQIDKLKLINELKKD